MHTRKTEKVNVTVTKPSECLRRSQSNTTCSRQHSHCQLVFLQEALRVRPPPCSMGPTVGALPSSMDDQPYPTAIFPSLKGSRNGPYLLRSHCLRLQRVCQRDNRLPREDMVVPKASLLQASVKHHCSKIFLRRALHLRQDSRLHLVLVLLLLRVLHLACHQDSNLRAMDADDDI